MKISLISHIFFQMLFMRCLTKWNGGDVFLRSAHAAVWHTPGWLLKSRMRWWDCSRSGFDDDRFPLTGSGGGICLDCFIPTMLSSCDWPTQTSLWKQEGEQGRGETAVLSTKGRGRRECGREVEAADASSCAKHRLYSARNTPTFHTWYSESGATTGSVRVCELKYHVEISWNIRITDWEAFCHQGRVTNTERLFSQTYLQYLSVCSQSDHS